MNDLDMQEVVVSSIIESLKDYLSSKDVESLFRMGSKLSFVAYTLDASVDDSLVAVVPALIQFTEIIHKISDDEDQLKMFDDIIVAFLHDLQFWLTNYFIEKRLELLPSNITLSLISSVQNMQLLLEDKEPTVDNIDDIFF